MMKIEENLNLIRKITWGFVRDTGFEFDDLFSEACLACLEVQNKYNPDKGAETTFIVHVVSNHLRNVTNREAIRGTKEQQKYIRNYYPSPEEELLAKEEWEGILRSLSPKSKEIYSLLVNENKPFLPLDKPKLCRGAIKEELRKRGWSWTEIWNSFRELKEVLA
jgi:RNA polymerase sigma factor (sigma-70 family)